jgi:hypothetical protein
MSWCEAGSVRHGREEVLRGWVGLDGWRTVVFRLNAPFQNQIPLQYAISWPEINFNQNRRVSLYGRYLARPVHLKAKRIQPQVRSEQM